MTKKRAIWAAVLVLSCIFLLSVLRFGYFNLTGFAVFTDSGTNFNNGTYLNTEFNGSSVILSGTNTSGNYTSQIFDAGNLAVWNNITSDRNIPIREDLFAVDGSGAVYFSSDSGAAWTQKTSNYGRGASTTDMFYNRGYLYIIFGGTAKETWRSSDSGVTWSIINDSFADSTLLLGDSDSSGNLFVVDGSGDVYKSGNSGLTWSLQGDFNAGASNAGKGIAINSNGIFIVDGSGAVWKSANSGVSWTEQNSGYGGSSGTDDMIVDNSGNLYILLNSAIYKSTDQGASWSIINSDYGGNQDGLTMISDSSDNFYIIDTSGDVYKSTNFGLAWSLISDFNGADTSNVKGFTNYFAYTNLTYQFRNCSSSDCSDGIFIGPDGTGNTYYSGLTADINRNGRYFQYKSYFSSEAGGTTPSLSSVAIDYDLGAVSPNVSIIFPNEGRVFGTNESLGLNFSITNETALDSCWYTLDSGKTNNSIPNCQNTTFDVAQSGNYTLYLYANESVSGLEGSDSVGFSVQLGAPEIQIIFPLNDDYANDNPVNFTFNATSDLGIDSCGLWGDFIGIYQRNQTNSNIISGELGYFFLNLSDGEYTWNVACNNTQGVEGNTGNLSFILDTGLPDVDIFEPNGTYNDTNNIPLNYTVNDSSPLVQCTYNLSFSVGGQTVDVGVIGDCENTVISVNTPTSYDLELTAEDEASNEGSSTTTFVVSGSGSGGGSSGSSGSGGGGGSGSFSGVSGPAGLEIEELADIELRRGQSDLINLQVKNSGARFLNDCRLSVVGELRDWISNEQSESIASGEEAEFVFAINAPRSAEAGQYLSVLVIECSEVKESTPLNVEILPSGFDFFVLSTNREGLKLIATYVLQDNSGENQEIRLRYVLLNGNGLKITEGIENILLAANQREERRLEIDLPRSAEGNYVLTFEVAGEGDEFDFEQPISLSGVTGFAISDDNLRTLSVFGIVLLVLGILVFAVRFMQKHYARTDKKPERFIKLKISPQDNFK